MDNRRRKQLIVVGLVNSAVVPNSYRGRFLAHAGVTVGPDVFISPGSFFVGDSWMSVAAGSTLAYQGYFDFAAPIQIGERVRIGPRTMIVTGAHEIGGRDRRGGDLTPQPVTVGDGCWLGAGATVLPGVTVAPGCVIGAGAVVTRDTEPDGVYAGVPARRVRDLPD